MCAKAEESSILFFAVCGGVWDEGLTGINRGVRSLLLIHHIFPLPLTLCTHTQEVCRGYHFLSHTCVIIGTRWEIGTVEEGGGKESSCDVDRIRSYTRPTKGLTVL
jgi:hypothetical protein